MYALSVVTFNTWKCDGDYPNRLELAAASLGRLAPDLVLLQEAFRSQDGAWDTAAFLARALGLNPVFHLARFKARVLCGQIVPGWSGLAVLSRFPLTGSGALGLTADPCDGDRWAQWVDIDAGGLPVRLVNTHLCHLKDREDLREQQLREAAGLMQSSEDRLVLLGGDLNTGTEGTSLRALSAMRAFSVWEDCGVRCPGTYPVNRPEACLDHLYRLASSTFDARWREVERVLDEPDRHAGFASDHAGILGHLTVACE